VLVLDERHQVHVVLALDDEDALAGVPVGVRVFQDVEQLATLDVEDDGLEPDAAVRPELRVLRVVPGELLHCHQRRQRVPIRHTLASAGVSAPTSDTDFGELRSRAQLLVNTGRLLGSDVKDARDYRRRDSVALAGAT